MTRSFWVSLHRWAGLSMAGFLILVGLTGSLLAFGHELNHWLTPNLYPGPHAGIQLAPAALLRSAEALVPDALATSVDLSVDGTAIIRMEARPGAPAFDFNRLLLDPVTGQELGRFDRDGLPTTLANVMPFIDRLHYSLAMGEVGAWILGIVALVWTIDCFVGVYLTLPLPSPPNRRGYLSRWRPAWLIKFRSSFYRVNFDLHRAFGLWLFAILLLFAWSSVHFNLNGFYTRTMQLVFDYEPPYSGTTKGGNPAGGRAPVGWEEAQAIGERLMGEQALAHGFSVERPMRLSIQRKSDLYFYGVRSSHDIGDNFGRTSIAFDAYTGELRAVRLPTGRHAGNTITTWLVELHMANVFGLPYRIFVCALGLVIVMLSVTGVYIWWKKCVARRDAASSRATIDENRIGAAVLTNSASLLFRDERPSPNCTTTRRPRSA